MTIRAVPLFVAIALGMSGCISLFPKAEPLTTYRLYPTVPTPAQDAGTGAVVLRSPTIFTRAAAGDRIFTVTGAEAATIAGARWVAPASVMFDESLSAAFAGSTTRLTSRGDVTAADQVLRVEVRTFEARYPGGEGASPTVVIEARASLTNLRDLKASTSREFRVEQAASTNRVGAIVDAYNAATTTLVTDVVRWTESQAPARRAG